MMPVIRKPEITKKTSTPTNPPGAATGKAWKFTTSNTATARRPSTSGRYWEEGRDNGVLTRIAVDDRHDCRPPCRHSLAGPQRPAIPVATTARNAPVEGAKSAVESCFSKASKSAPGGLEKV